MSFKKNISVLIFIMTLCYFPSWSQISQRSEVGFGLGVFTYTGDLSRTYNFANSRPAATIFYRLNISKAISFKTSITGGMLEADDSNQPLDAFAKQRAAYFSIFLLEAAATFEYHFLNWRDNEHRIRFTPFLFAGVGLFGISGEQPKSAEYSNVQFSIPFGGGIKYIVNPKLYLTLEGGVRKTFFDYLDNISYNDPANKNYQYGDTYDDDNYFYLGISINYTFYDIPCSGTPYK